MEADPVLIRQFAPGDTAYLFSNWLRDLRAADPSGLPDDLWFPPHREFITRALADGATTCLIAAASDQPNEILGFVVARPEELLWVHVRKGLRQQGIAKRLLLAASVQPSLPTRFATPLGRERLPNPFRSRQLRTSPTARMTKP